MKRGFLLLLNDFYLAITLMCTWYNTFSKTQNFGKAYPAHRCRAVHFSRLVSCCIASVCVGSRCCLRHGALAHNILRRAAASIPDQNKSQVNQLLKVDPVRIIYKPPAGFIKIG